MLSVDVEKQLPFPAFHKSIMHRNSIDAAEDYGRVKIFISEGFNILAGGKVRFRPISHVACFSFLHAPLG